MKKIIILVISVLFSIATQAQNLSVERPFTSFGTNDQITTGAVDTTYFKVEMPTSGDLTLALTFTGQTGNTITGVSKLWVSLDDKSYWLYPLPNAIDSITKTYNAVALVATPTQYPTTTRAYTYTKFYTFPYAITTSGTSNIVEGNPFKYYLWEFISTTATSGTLTLSAKAQCKVDGK